MIKVEDGNIIRNKVDGGDGVPKTDTFILDKSGNITENLVFDFDNITKISIYPIYRETRKIENGYFLTRTFNRVYEETDQTTSKTKTRFGNVNRNISITRSNVVVRNLKHELDETNTNKANSTVTYQFIGGENSTTQTAYGNAYTGFLNFQDSAKIKIEDSNFSSHTFSGLGGTYDFIINRCANIILNNVGYQVKAGQPEDDAYKENVMNRREKWSILAMNNNKNMKVSRCRLNSFSSHSDTYNVDIKDSVIGGRGLILSGGGYLNVADTTFDGCRSLFKFHDNYGSYFNGQVTIRNSTYKPNVQNDNVYLLFGLYDEKTNYGVEPEFPNVIIDGITIDDTNIKNKPDPETNENNNKPKGTWIPYIYLLGYNENKEKVPDDGKPIYKYDFKDMIQVNNIKIVRKNKETQKEEKSPRRLIAYSRYFIDNCLSLYRDASKPKTPDNYKYRTNNKTNIVVKNTDIKVNAQNGEDNKFNTYINPILVTFNPNGGIGEMAGQIVGDKDIKNIRENVFTREGYKFIGWSTQPGNSQVTYTDKDDFSKITGETTLYAQWERQSYDVTIDPNGGKYNGKTESVTLNNVYGTSIDIANPEPPKGDVITFISNGGTKFDNISTIKIFKGWLNDGQGKILGNKYTYGEGKGKIVAKYGNKKKALPVPVREGYKFSGCNAQPSGIGTIYTDEEDLENCQGNITLYAQWKANEYTVTFDPNGGLGSIDPQTVKHNRNIKLSKNIFTKEKSVFTGWNTEANGQGTAYTDEQEIKNVKSDITLYAQWKASEYTVTFNSNGGTGNINPQTVKHDQNIKLSKNTFTKEGHTFTGWNTEANGKGTAYADEQEIKNVKADITLYAQWKANEYTVTFNSNGGTGNINPQTVRHDQNIKLSKNTFTKEGHTFTGWNTEANGQGTAYADEQEIKNVKSNITLYAQWKKEKYNLTINPNGGKYNGKAENTVLNNELGKTIEIANPEAPKGYTITLDTKGGNKLENITTTKTFKAWTKEGKGNLVGNKYTYEAGDGTLTATYEDSKVKLPSPTREGYTFIGWYEGETKTDNEYIAKKDVKLIAKWVKENPKEPWNLEISYSNKEKTNKDIKVSIISNKKLKEKEGWILENGGYVLTKIYETNTNEEITIFNIDQEEQKVNVVIDNIDKTPIKLKVEYEDTNDGIIVKIISNKELKEKKDWKLSKDKKTMTKKYEYNNSNEEIEIEDEWGNTDKAIIDIEKYIKPEENKPEEIKPEEIKPEENKPEENKPEQEKTEEDKTTNDKLIPNAGKISLIGAISVTALVAIVSKKKYNKYKGI